MLEDDVRAVFTEVLDLTPPIDWPAVHYQRTEAWDSLVHMALVTRLEQRFGVTLTDEEIVSFDDVTSAVAIIAGHRAGQP